MKTRIISKALGSLVIALGICVIVPSMAGAWTLRSLTGAGPNGSGSVTTYTDNNGNKIINCTGAGFSGCPTSCADPAQQPGMNYAVGQIGNSVLTGSYSDPTNGTTTTWTASDVNNSSIIVNEGSGTLTMQ